MTVVNIKNSSFDIYIGRSTKYGNPFPVSKYGLEKSLRYYRAHLECLIAQGSITKEELLALRGKVLGCHCKPNKCHGDILEEFIYSEQPSTL